MRSALIGKKSQFGFQLDLPEDHNAEWLLGRCCWWVNGTEIGDYALGTSLRDVLFQMEPILRDAGKRDGGKLCAYSAADLIVLLRGILYEDGRHIDIPSVESIEMPARFDVRIPVDVFDSCSIFLIRCGDNDRLIYGVLDSGEAYEAILPVGYFDRVMKEAYDFLAELYEEALKA